MKKLFIFIRLVVFFTIMFALIIVLGKVFTPKWKNGTLSKMDGQDYTINGYYELPKNSIDVLKQGGRLCVITFHSLEDRAVKQAMNRAKGMCTCPKDIPYCVCGAKELGTVITRKPIIASEEEQKENSRSKSAKLRIFEKI